MTEFQLPYQHVRLAFAEDDDDRITVGNLRLGHDGAYRHDAWSQQHCSGRIICALTLETPLLTAQVSPNGQLAKFEGFDVLQMYPRLFGDTDKAYYIAANSLRGMISNLVECISASALRVQSDEPLSISLGKNNSKGLGNLHGYVPDALLPLGAAARSNGRSKELTRKDIEKTSLSVAELLFGFVPTQKPADSLSSIAYASRVRLSDGRHIPRNAQDPLLQPELLRELATPKSQSHNMYFHERAGVERGIKKGNLDKKHHAHNGRKFYLHPTQAMIDESWWFDQKRPKKRAEFRYAARPMRAAETFAFHVDFDNLSKEELGVLLHCLRPAENFRHKLGMGKPIGLGSVRIDIQGVFMTEYTERYGRNAFDRAQKNDTALHSRPFSVSGMESNSDVRRHYRHLFSNGAPPEPLAPAQTLINRNSHLQISMIGAWPNEFREGIVSYPYVTDKQGRPTGTGYDWYIANDAQSSPQTLPGLAGKQALPTLKTYPEK